MHDVSIEHARAIVEKLDDQCIMIIGARGMCSLVASGHAGNQAAREHRTGTTTLIVFDSGRTR